MKQATDPIRDLLAAQERVIETLQEQVALQASLLRAHENANAWRAAVRSGSATVEEFAAAIELEETGEGSDLLPRGFVRGPTGQVVRADADGEPQPPEPTPTSLDISETFLGRLGRA